MDSELKQIVTRGAAATNMFILSKFQAINNTALQKLVKNEGVKLNSYSNELINADGVRATEVLLRLLQNLPTPKSYTIIL